MDTSGFAGKKLEKSAEVLSNDPKQPVAHLSIAGIVDKFASINPRMLNLRGVAGETLRGTVTIAPEDKYPFKVLGATARDGRLRVFLSEGKEEGKASYSLQVENVKTEAGSFNDSVLLKTDSQLQPELEVRVYVYLRVPQPGEQKAK